MPSEITAESGRRFRRLQARAFALTWLSYASYYFTRKNFSVVKSRLHDDMGMSVGMLGGIDTLYLSLYAAGQFLNGALGDRIGARRMIAAGMIASAALSAWFGFGSAAWIFAAAFGLNGLFQSTGWPNNVKAMGPWFGREKRGFVMGIWCTNYQAGGLVATALATFLLVHYGWRASFHVPAIWVAAVGLVILRFLVEKPQDRGLPPAPEKEERSNEAPRAEPRSEKGAFFRIIRRPEIWILGSAYFGLKLIRYSLLFWLPFYLKQGLGYSEGAAGYLSTAFEAGGIVGAIVVGLAADRFFSANPIRLVAPILLALAASFLLMRTTASLGIVPVAATLGLIGFLLFGPDALISGAAAQNIGGGGATASAAGVINGLGSIGAAAQGFVTAFVSQRWGWDALFVVFLGFAVLSTAALLPLAFRQKV